MTDDQSGPVKVVTAMFGLLTARLEDEAGLAADGQDPAADHRPIASQIDVCFAPHVRALSGRSSNLESGRLPATPLATCARVCH